MEVNDILSLNYEPFVRHFINQATGKSTHANSKNNLVVVRAKKEAKQKTAEPAVTLVSPVSLNIDQAKVAVKHTAKETSIPAEITDIQGVTQPRKQKRKAKQSNKSQKQKRRKVADIFSKK